jgi:hypothetical protein
MKLLNSGRFFRKIKKKGFWVLGIGYWVLGFRFWFLGFLGFGSGNSEAVILT